MKLAEFYLNLPGITALDFVAKFELLFAVSALLHDQFYKPENVSLFQVMHCIVYVSCCIYSVTRNKMRPRGIMRQLSFYEF